MKLDTETKVTMIVIAIAVLYWGITFITGYYVGTQIRSFVLDANDFSYNTRILLGAMFFISFITVIEYGRKIILVSVNKYIDRVF